MIAPIARKRSPSSKYRLFAGTRSFTPSLPPFSHLWINKWSTTTVILHQAATTRSMYSILTGIHLRGMGGMGKDRWWVGEWHGSGGCLRRGRGREMRWRMRICCFIGGYGMSRGRFVFCFCCECLDCDVRLLFWKKGGGFMSHSIAFFRNFFSKLKDAWSQSLRAPN